MTSHEPYMKVFGNLITLPRISIVIVAYNTGDELFDCLDSLGRQTVTDFEIILVDNATTDEKKLHDYNLRYCWTGKNLGPSAARNVGLQHARADVVSFLDDDAIADEKWVESILHAFEDTTIMALRGKIIPKHPERVLNDLQSHYDLGADIMDYYIDLEGNSAFRKDALVHVGGFAASLFGHEGAELSYKLQKTYPNERVVYTPQVLIFHDYADSAFHVFRKAFRHGTMSNTLQNTTPEILSYVAQMYTKVPVRTKPLFTRLLMKVNQAVMLCGEMYAKWKK